MSSVKKQFSLPRSEAALTCILHRSSYFSGDHIASFSDTSLARVQKCCRFWKSTSWISEVDIAKRFEEVAQKGLTDYGYHFYCYLQFTRKNRMQKAQAESLRKDAILSTENAFPRRCIFCSNYKKLTTLSRCSTPDLAGKIVAAAAERKDCKILEWICSQDLVAHGLHYHLKCYMRYIYHSHQATQFMLPATVEAAFRDFVVNGITTVEHSSVTCVPVTALGPLFVKTVADVGAYSAYQGKVGYLFANFKRYCPYPLYSGGKLGVKPELENRICRNQDNEIVLGEAVWENNGEAVDFQDSLIVEGDALLGDCDNMDFENHTAEDDPIIRNSKTDVDDLQCVTIECKDTN